MKKLEDFPISDVSPFEFMLRRKLEDCSSNRVVKYGDTAYVDYNMYQNNLEARMVLRQKVDKEKFVKVYKDSIRYICKLSRTAQALLWYIMDVIPQDKAYVWIDNSSAKEVCNFKTTKSIINGTKELLEKNIIARSPIPKKFWVNPLVLFNGNRIVYAREYILDDAG